MMLERLAEARLREAEAIGSFEGLSNRGRPLALDDETHIPPEWRLTFRVLRNAGFRPAWIEMRQEIYAMAAQARARLAVVPMADPGRAAAVARFTMDVASLNRRIRELNLRVPSPRWQLRLLDPGDEIARMEAGHASVGPLGPP